MGPGRVRRLKKRLLRPAQSHARRWWVGAREQFARGAAIGTSPLQHSLWKQPRGSRHKQAEMGAADHSRHSETK